jgi:hypothetical protein
MSDYLKYTKQSKKRAFTDKYFNKKFSDVNNMTPAQQTGIFYKKANELRAGFKPIFVNETQYLPNIKGDNLTEFSEKLDVSSNNLKISKKNSISSKSLTIPPNKKSDYPLLQFLLVGTSIYLIYKIIED